MDSIDLADKMHRKQMQAGSQALAECIRRALSGAPTNSPSRWRPVPMLNQKPIAYTADEIESIRQMRLRGMTCGQIAHKVGRNPNAISGIIRRYVEGGK